MTETQFNQLVDEQFLAIEEAIDQSEADIDYETHGGILTLEFVDRSQIVINRQTPMRQIWVASKYGGHHFEQQQGQWLDTRTGEELYTLLADHIVRQSGERVTF